MSLCNWSRPPFWMKEVCLGIFHCSVSVCIFTHWYLYLNFRKRLSTGFSTGCVIDAEPEKWSESGVWAERKGESQTFVSAEQKQLLFVLCRSSVRFPLGSVWLLLCLQTTDLHKLRCLSLSASALGLSTSLPLSHSHSHSSVVLARPEMKSCLCVF